MEFSRHGKSGLHARGEAWEAPSYWKIKTQNKQKNSDDQMVVVPKATLKIQGGTFKSYYHLVYVVDEPKARNQKV